MADYSLKNDLADLNASLDSFKGNLDSLFDGLARIRKALGLPPAEYPADTRDILAAAYGLGDLRAEVAAYLGDPNHPGERALYDALARCSGEG